MSHPIDEVNLAGLDARGAVPWVLFRLVLRGELAIAPKDKAFLVENPGTVVATGHLAVFPTAAALRKEEGGKKEGRKEGREGGDGRGSCI